MTQPRFNHVALSVPSAALDDEGRAEIVEFYADVFGWSEMDTMTRAGEQLVLQAYRYDQFVFVLSNDDPMRCAERDHFGMAVTSREEFDAFHERVRARAGADDRIELTEATHETFGDYLVLHSFYLKHLLPMMIEIQYYEWAEGLDPAAT